MNDDDNDEIDAMEDEDYDNSRDSINHGDNDEDKDHESDYVLRTGASEVDKDLEYFPTLDTQAHTETDMDMEYNRPELDTSVIKTRLQVAYNYIQEGADVGDVGGDVGGDVRVRLSDAGGDVGGDVRGRLSNVDGYVGGDVRGRLSDAGGDVVGDAGGDTRGRLRQDTPIPPPAHEQLSSGRYEQEMTIQGNLIQYVRICVHGYLRAY
nr:uncharacterized protein LOC113829376 [Penaeus vannamei]